MKHALLLLALVACQQAPSNADAAPATNGDPPATCTKLGAPCTFAPGKLGSCVEVEQRAGASTFVCQSQH